MENNLITNLTLILPMNFNHFPSSVRNTVLGTVGTVRRPLYLLPEELYFANVAMERMDQLQAYK